MVDERTTRPAKNALLDGITIYVLGAACVKRPWKRNKPTGWERPSQENP